MSEELRLRYRYLDLRKDAMRDQITLRHAVVKEIRDHLSEEGFLEIETPILTRSTPRARDFLVPSRLVAGSWYALPQSPQLFKQLLMIGGLERYFQIARCRDEAFRADRQPEFTQLDLEMSFVDEEDVYATIDPLLERVLAVGGIEIELPIERIGYDEAMLRYGSDRPDRRLGVEIADLSDVFRSSGFKVFAGAIADGGVVRALKAGGEWPRSRFDALTERAHRSEPRGWRGPSSRMAAGARRSRSSYPRTRWGHRRARRAGRRGGADRGRQARDGGTGARRAATRGGGRGARGHDIFWVVDFPMFEWNEDEGR